MQAVLKVKSNQYLVSTGDEILIPHIDQTSGPISFDQILLVFDNDQIQIGKPFLPKYQVQAMVLGPQKTRKIRVMKYKPKSRYRKVKGARPLYTKIKIQDIKTLESSDSVK